jgi:hypothetical protein
MRAMMQAVRVGSDPTYQSRQDSEARGQGRETDNNVVADTADKDEVELFSLDLFLDACPVDQLLIANKAASRGAGNC